MSIMKVGIIGGSNIATSVHLPLLSCMDDITIEYIAARKNPKILAKLYDAKPIQITENSSLPECDIALITIPAGARNEYLYQFAKTDSYVLTEKPFAIDLKTHQNILELSNRFSCNYERIFFNTTQNIKNIISSEIFGKIKKISISEGTIYGKTGIKKNSYRNDPKLSGGFLNESACHTLSQLNFLFDHLNVESANIIWQDNFDIESSIVFQTDHKDSFIIEYLGTNLKNLKPNFTIIFEEIKIEFNHIVPDSIFTISKLNSNEKFTLQQENKFATTFPEAYYLKWHDFLNKVSSSSKLNSEFETSLKTTQLISDIFEKGTKK